MKEQSLDRFIDDHQAGEQEQSRLDEGGEVFDLFMAVLVIGIGGFVGKPDRNPRDDGRDQNESGMRGFRENAETACREADIHFKGGNRNSR